MQCGFISRMSTVWAYCAVWVYREVEYSVGLLSG